MDDVKPRNEIGAGELAAEREHRDVRTDDWNRLGDSVSDAQARARQEVVGERVTAKTFEDTEGHQRETDEPVCFTWLAERAGEEDAAHVADDRRHEDERRPVVNLPNKQTTPDVEGDAQR